MIELIKENDFLITKIKIMLNSIHGNSVGYALSPEDYVEYINIKKEYYSGDSNPSNINSRLKIIINQIKEKRI